MSSINSYLYGTNSASSIGTLFGTNNATSANAQGKNDLYSALLEQYGQNTATGLPSDLQGYITTIKTAGASLKSTLNDTMSGNTKNVLYNQKAITSSNSDVISTSSKSYSVSSTDSLKDTKMTVQQIAANQVNEGSGLSKDSLSIGTGYKSMTITSTDGKEHTFSVSPLITQTDGKVQSQLAEKINSANIGITAKVEVDSKTNTSKLVLASNSTGEDSAFSVSGNLAEALGISEATTQAQNAVYTVNGQEKISQSNNVEVNGISLTLKKASDEEITFTEKSDNTNLINSARDIVNQFNKMMEAVKDNSTDSGAEKLFNSLSSIAKTYTNSLVKSGISINDEGYMEIDEEQMAKAAESGDLQKLVGKDSGFTNYGFSSRLEQLATRVSDNPMNFLSSDARLEVSGSSQSFVSGSSTSAATFVSRMNNYYNVGILFDSMF